MLKGWKTLAIGLLMVIAPGAITYLAGVDWTALVGPTGAFAISGVLMIALRVVTTTPIGKSTPPVKIVTGGPSNPNFGAKVGALIGLIVGLSLLMPPQARAADVTLPKPKSTIASLFTGYTSGSCGMYFGINTIGGAGSVNGGPPGASVIQGGLGGTLGYGCPIGTTPGNFWFVEGNFDWTNINGSANGFAITGPAHFEQRFGLGSPISTMLSMTPFGNGLSVPSLPALPAGVTQGPSYPFIFVAMHEQDVSAQFGLDNNRQWLISPGVGIGIESRLSNNVVAETAAQWVMQSNGLSVGPQSVKLGNAVEVSFTLKY